MKKLDAASIDYVFILTEEGTKYLIPVDELGGTSGIALGNGYDKFIV